MAMEVDVVLLAAGDLCTHRLVDGLTAGKPARFLQCQVAFVEGDVAAMAGDDIDLAALGLRTALVFPSAERLAMIEQNDLAPPRLLIGRDALLDRLVLRGPERRQIGEVALLAEQVGDDGAGVVLDLEQRGRNRDRSAAEHPGLKRLADRAIAGRVVEQHQPLLLLRAWLPASDA